MIKSKTRASYRSFCTPWKEIRDGWNASPPKGGLICLWGPDSYLLYRGNRLLRAYWKQSTKEQTRVLEPGDLKGQDPLGTVWQDRDLFASHTLNILFQAEKNKSLARHLKQIPSAKSLENPLVISYQGKSLPAALKAELKRLTALEIPCFPPLGKELPSFIRHLTGEKGLKLQQSASELISESIGDDLFKIENELDKLAVIFSGKEQELSAGDIAPHLGLLRQDHVFRLSSLLCTGKNAAALDLSLDLLQRGESAIALTGILSKHLRTALTVRQSLTRGQTQDLGRRLRLPYPVVKDYIAYCRKTSGRHLQDKLAECQQADMILKGLMKMPEDLILSQLISDL